MAKDIATMLTALRVLTAVTYQRQPEISDVEELRRIWPAFADLEPDELACEAIERTRKALGSLDHASTAAA